MRANKQHPDPLQYWRYTFFCEGCGAYVQASPKGVNLKGSDSQDFFVRCVICSTEKSILKEDLIPEITRELTRKARLAKDDQAT